MAFSSFSSAFFTPSRRGGVGKERRGGGEEKRRRRGEGEGGGEREGEGGAEEGCGVGGEERREGEECTSDEGGRMRWVVV